MADTTFVDQTTIIVSAWLNDVNDATYHAIGDGVNAPTTPAEVRTNLDLETTGSTLLRGDGAGGTTNASSGDVTSLIGATPVTNATNATNATNVVSGGTIASNVTATTQAPNDNSTKVATTAYADAAGGTVAQITAALPFEIGATVGSNALTVTLDPCTIGFSSSTLTNGSITYVNVPSQISVVVSSGSTLGTTSNVQSDIGVIAINNAGTVELAVVNLAGGVNLSELNLINTTAEGGAGGADSASTIYSTTARSNVAYRVVGFVRSTQTTAGTWATSPTLIRTKNDAFMLVRCPTVLRLDTANGYGSTNTVIRRFTNSSQKGTDVTYADSATAGASITVNTPGLYSLSYSDAFNSQAHYGLSVNSTQLTTAIITITAADALIFDYTPAANNEGALSVTYWFNAGDIIRPHTSGQTGAPSTGLSKLVLTGPF